MFFCIPLEKHKAIASFDGKLDAVYQDFISYPGCTNVSLQEVKNMSTIIISKHTKENNIRQNINETNQNDEEEDEFVSNDSSFNDDSNEPTTEYPSICDKNHWAHLFSDKDVSVECILTEQLLQIRKSLKSSFKGCDIYKPKKPKGLASMVLDEWKKYYPDSEETNKTIGIYF